MCNNITILSMHSYSHVIIIVICYVTLPSLIASMIDVKKVTYATMLHLSKQAQYLNFLMLAVLSTGKSHDRNNYLDLYI